jgi:hypothetical protein
MMLIAQGHIEDGIKLLSPDVTYRVGGEHALAGDFKGREHTAAHLTELTTRTMGTLDLIKFEDWLVGESHFAALVTIIMRSDGRVSNVSKGGHVFIFRFDADERIVDIRVLFEDERYIERFFGK